MNQKHRIKYEIDPKHGLDEYLFRQLTCVSSLVELHKCEMEEMLAELRDERIDVLTLEQGTADWHRCRQFSLTSSQASGSFRMAFILFQADGSWCDVATYLYGEEYEKREFYCHL